MKNEYRVEFLINHFDSSDDKELLGDFFSEDEKPTLNSVNYEDIEKFMTHLKLLQTIPPFKLADHFDSPNMIENGLPKEFDDLMTRSKKDLANYDIDELFNLTILTTTLNAELMSDYYTGMISSMLKGRTIDQLRDILELTPDDVDGDEEDTEALKEEAKWISDESLKDRIECEKKRDKLRIEKEKEKIVSKKDESSDSESE